MDQVRAEFSAHAAENSAHIPSAGSARRSERGSWCRRVFRGSGWAASPEGGAGPGRTGAVRRRELDRLAGVVTGCAVAIAETGTIVLDHGAGQGRRALTLVPDFHLVIVRADQVAADLPGGVRAAGPGRGRRR